MIGAGGDRARRSRYDKAGREADPGAPGTSSAPTLRPVGGNEVGYSAADRLRARASGNRPSWRSAPPGESYQYDPRQRLIRASRSGLAAVDYSYAANGNPEFKSDYASNYRYGSGNSTASNDAGPHAVTSVNRVGNNSLQTYLYDNNGNLTGGNTLSAKYDHDNQPWSVARIGAGFDRFAYGANGERFKHTDSSGAVTYYGSSGYEKTLRAGSTEHRHHLPGVILNITGANAQTGSKVFTYRHEDRLGSTVALSNAAAAIIERRSFDAFGQTRNGDLSDKANGTLNLNPPENRGFTQHEHLDQTYLIHMNGRTYDYRLGRFLAVDPFIQFPTNSQSLNPYSYVLNNPLSGTDPSGFAACGESIDDKEVCQITVAVAVKDSGSRITRTETQTFTVANNGGAILVTAGGDRAAFDRIEAAIIGNVAERSSGPTVGATPMKVRSVGVRGRGMVQSLFDPNEPNPVSAAVGEVIGAFSKPDPESGLRTNPVTGADVKNPQETRENTLFGAMLLLVPGAPEVGIGSKGLSSEANFAQRTFRETFSDGGIEEFKKTLGIGVKTINDLVEAIASGRISSNQVIINYIDRNGNVLILNTRSVKALERAGVPRSEFSTSNRTGDALFERLLDGQLNNPKNQLTEKGIKTVVPEE